jgi:hypothetical protein
VYTPHNVNVWLQSRSLPARGCVGLEVHRCVCADDARNAFISTVLSGEESPASSLSPVLCGVGVSSRTLRAWLAEIL